MARKTGAKKPGAPRKEVDKKMLLALAAIGASQEEICIALTKAGCAIDRRTLLRRLEDPEYRAIWEAGRNDFKLGIRRLQLRHAKMPNSAGVQMTIHMSKHHLGESEKSLLEVAGKNGGPIQMMDLSKATDEQLTALESLFGPLAGAAGGDDQGNPGGESSSGAPATP